MFCLPAPLPRFLRCLLLYLERHLSLPLSLFAIELAKKKINAAAVVVDDAPTFSQDIGFFLYRTSDGFIYWPG